MNVFSPVNDLSTLSKTGNASTLVAGQTNDVAIAGGQILGDEWSDHVVKVTFSMMYGSSQYLILNALESFGYYFKRGVRLLDLAFLMDGLKEYCSFVVPF